MTELLDAVPEEYRDRFSELLRLEPADMGELRAELCAYLETVRLVAARVELMVVDRAKAITETLLALLDRAESPLHQRAVAAAVRYFLTEDDDEEITGVLCLDDDIQVVNAVCAWVGAPDLVVSRG